MGGWEGAVCVGGQVFCLGLKSLLEEAPESGASCVCRLNGTDLGREHASLAYGVQCQSDLSGELGLWPPSTERQHGTCLNM